MLNIFSGGWLRLAPYAATAIMALALMIGWAIHKRDMAKIEAVQATASAAMAENERFAAVSKAMQANQSRNDAAVAEIHLQTVERARWLAETKGKTDAIAKNDDLAACAPGISLALDRMRQRKAGDLQAGGDPAVGPR